VASNDLAKFDQFRKKFEPSYGQQGEGMAMQWPDDPAIGGSGAAAVDDDDDLYA